MNKVSSVYCCSDMIMQLLITITFNLKNHILSKNITIFHPKIRYIFILKTNSVEVTTHPTTNISFKLILHKGWDWP